MSNQQIEWVLNDTKETIIGRGKERDLNEGERTIPKCVVAFNSITGHRLSNEDGWLFMQVLKMCRSVQGSYKYDDYRDGIGYAALRAEEAIMTDKKRKDSATCVRPMTEQDPKQARPGQVIEVCKHKRSNCYECGLQNEIDVRPGSSTSRSLLVPPECDTRDRNE